MNCEMCGVVNPDVYWRDNSYANRVGMYACPDCWENDAADLFAANKEKEEKNNV